MDQHRLGGHCWSPLALGTKNSGKFKIWEQNRALSKPVMKKGKNPTNPTPGHVPGGQPNLGLLSVPVQPRVQGSVGLKSAIETALSEMFNKRLCRQRCFIQRSVLRFGTAWLWWKKPPLWADGDLSALLSPVTKPWCFQWDQKLDCLCKGRTGGFTSVPLI